MRTEVRGRLESFIKRHRVFTAAQAKALGISSGLLAHYAKKGLLRRVGRGLYVSAQHEPEIDPIWEELVYSVLSIPNAVVCYTTALILHGLTDEVARQYWVAIPHDTTVGKRPHVRTVRMRHHGLGISKIKLGEIDVPVYDLERSLVEGFKSASLDVAIKALKQAFEPGRKPRPSPAKLYEYAKKLRVPIDQYLTMVTTT